MPPSMSTAESPLTVPLLAVAISELLFASFAELLLEQHTDPSQPKPPPPTTVVQAWSGRVEEKLKQPVPPLGIELGVLGSILVQRDTPSLLAGGGLRVARPRPSGARFIRRRAPVQHRGAGRLAALPA